MLGLCGHWGAIRVSWLCDGVAPHTELQVAHLTALDNIRLVGNAHTRPHEAGSHLADGELLVHKLQVIAHVEPLGDAEHAGNRREIRRRVLLVAVDIVQGLQRALVLSEQSVRLLDVQELLAELVGVLQGGRVHVWLHLIEEELAQGR